MTRVAFDFSEVVIDCLHDEEIKFTNAIDPEVDSSEFIAELFQNLRLTCQEAELEELFKQEHFHFVNSLYIKKKIERLVNDHYFESEKLCQIPLDKKPRLYVNLKRLNILISP